MAVFANLYYGFPSRSLKVIGVTGTDGKTTTTHLIYHILKSAGKSVSMISTVYAKVADVRYDTGLHTTTPSSFLVQKLLRLAAENREEYFVLETTSHALDQNRVWGIKFLISVVTNVTHEHLDYHRYFDQYLKAKAKIFKQSKTCLLNVDDHSYDFLKQEINNNNVYTYGLVNKAAFNLDFGKIDGRIAKFNQYNYLAGYSVARLLNIEESVIFKSFSTFKLPAGRLEFVYQKKFSIVVDFAHTPNAFSQLLPELLKHLKKDARLIHVFGAAGLRDRSKRFEMGRISGQYSDEIILTEEDYRTESLYKICEQIGKGINSVQKKYIIKEKRQDAINYSIKIAKPGDIIAITGKAHEKSLCRGKTEFPWDEKKAINVALKKYVIL